MSCDFCNKPHVQGCWTGKEADVCGNLGQERRADLVKLGKIPQRPVIQHTMPIALDALIQISKGMLREEAQKMATEALDKIKNADAENAKAIEKYNKV